MDREQVTKIMGLIALEFGGRFDLSPERLDLWVEILQGSDFRAAQQATVRLLARPSGFPPQVGEVLEEANEIERGWREEARRKAERRAALEAPPPTPRTPEEQAKLDADVARARQKIREMTASIGRRVA